MSKQKTLSSGVGCIFVAALCILTIANGQAPASPPESVQHAQELMDQATKLYTEGKYSEGIPFAKEAADIREKLLGGDNADTASSLEMLGRLYRRSGDFVRAEPVLRRALAMQEKVLGPEHPEVARSLNGLAMVYEFKDDFANAELFYKRSLAINEKVLGPEHPRTALSIENLGILYDNFGYPGRAEAMFRRSLEIKLKTLGPDHADTATSFYNLAGLAYDRGDYIAAEEQYQQALTIYEKALTADHPQIGLAHDGLANAYFMSGAYVLAETHYQRAFDIATKTLGPEHPTTLLELNHLAIMYETLGEYSKAEPMFQSILERSEKQYGADHHEVAIILTNLATLYNDTRAFDKAEPLFLRALAIREKTLNPQHPETAVTLYSLGYLYQYRGEYGKAEKFYGRALAIQEKVSGPASPQATVTLNAMATLKWAEGDIESARRLLQRTGAIQTKIINQTLLTGSAARKKSYLLTVQRDMNRTVSFSVAVPGRDNAVLGLNSVLQYKGRVLDAMSESVLRLRKNIRKEDLALFEQLGQVANQFSTLTYQGPGSLTNEKYRQRLDELARQQEQLEGDLSTRSREIRQQLTPVTVESVRRAIPSDAALIEWIRYGVVSPKNARVKSPEELDKLTRYAAFVLKRNDDPVVVDLGDAATIDTMAHQFRVATSTPKSNDVLPTAAALSAVLIRSLSSHIKGVKHLLLSPDGALNLVPMAALLDDTGEYMAKRFEISYVTSGRDLLHTELHASSPTEPVIIADPEFGEKNQVAAAAPASKLQRSVDLDRSGLVFRPLANTELEAQDLKKLLNLGSSNVLLRADATETSLKQLHSPRILHVASHGFFLSDQELAAEVKKRSTSEQPAAPAGENPLLRSGIALAGANARRSGANDDGILTALEVAQIDLQGTQLVVLSACDSGVGDIQNGEGVYGLRRALVLAGAQTQVTSLWKVSDEATRMLMVDFYQRLLKGEGRSEALRHAQLAMLAKPELSHPYYWASFVPIGNWAPLPTIH